VVFKHLGVKREEVVLGPSAGFDGAVINVGNKSLIVSMDPITGAVERIGWLAVNINANDIATFGVEPTLFSSCILLPEKGERKTLETICAQMDEAAKDLGIAIIGCAMGITEKGKYVTAGDAKPRDKLILTKSAGIEGTAILAAEKEQQLKKTVNSTLLQRAKKFYNRISIVKDALIAVKTGGVHAMHDPTEGGVSGGIHEMAEASNVGFQVYEEKIPLQPETQKICDYFKIDPLQLISSGALLISAEPEFAEKIVRELKQNEIDASVIGEFLQNRREHKIVRKDGTIQTLPRPVSDNLWLALKS
jgi:hydrogenase maturation factor